MSSSTHKRSAGGRSRDRQDEAKRKKCCPESSCKHDHDTQKLDHIYAVWRKIMIKLKLELSHCNAPQSVFKECGKKIRERLISVVGQRKISSENQVLDIYRSRYSFCRDLELLNSIFHEYKQSKPYTESTEPYTESTEPYTESTELYTESTEPYTETTEPYTIPKNTPALKHTQDEPQCSTNIKEITKCAALEQSSLSRLTTVLDPYSIHLAKSVCNQSLCLKINSFALEFFITAAQHVILRELRAEYEDYMKIPQKYRDDFITYINCTLKSLLREDSNWHWFKFYELYRLKHNVQSDKLKLLEICKEQGFMMPEDTSQMARIPNSFQYTLKHSSGICMQTISHETKAIVGRTFYEVRLSVWLFKRCIRSVLQIILKKNAECPPVKEVLTVYRRYRSVQDDCELFSKCWQNMIQFARKDTLAKELISQINELQTMTPKSYFDLLKITASRIVGRVIKKFPTVAHIHVNLFLYEIIKCLDNLQFKEKNMHLSLMELYDVYTGHCTKEIYHKKFDYVIEEATGTISEIYDTSQVEAFGNPIQNEPLKDDEKKKTEKLPKLSSHQKKSNPPLRQEEDTKQDIEQKIVEVLKEKLNALFEKMSKVHQDELKNEQVNNLNLEATTSNGNNVPIDSINKCQERHYELQDTILEKEVLPMGNMDNNMHEVTECESTHMDCNDNSNTVLKNPELNQEKEVDGRVEIVANENSFTKKSGNSITSYRDTTGTTINIKSEPMCYEVEQSISINNHIENTLRQDILMNIKTEIHERKEMNTVKEENNFQNIISNIKSEPLDENEHIENYESKDWKKVKFEIIDPEEEVTKDLSDLISNMKNAYDTSVEQQSFFKEESDLRPDNVDSITSKVQEPLMTLDSNKPIENSAKQLKDTAGAQHHASTQEDQEVNKSTRINSLEKKSSEAESDILLRIPIQKIIDKHLPSIIPDMKKQVLPFISEDKQLLNYFGEQSDIGGSQLIKLSGLPTLPKLETLMNFLKEYKPKTIRMPKHLHNMIFVDTIEWQALLNLRQVILSESPVKIDLANQNLRRSEHMVIVSADGLSRSYTFDKSNSVTMNQEVQVNVTSDCVNIMNNSDTSKDVSVKSKDTTNIEIPGTSGTVWMTRKQKKNMHRSMRRRAKMVILKDEEYDEAICEEKIIAPAPKEKEFDKIIDDFDHELGDLLTTIKDSDVKL